MIKQNKGVALILTILLMSLLLFLAAYFLNFSVTEDKISKSQTEGEKTYYLAEAGVNEMIWKLKNNEAYKNNFEDNPAWTASFSRSDPFGVDSGSYEVAITNSSRAHGEIVSTGKINLTGGKTTQRVIKTTVYKALGQTGITDSAGYADGNIDISGSRVNFYNGSAHSNNEFTVNNGSVIFVDSDLRAAGNYILSWTSSSTIQGNIYAHNYPPEADEIEMPAVDFNSSDPDSYKNQADVVYSEDDFEELIEDNSSLTLNDPITYVTGDVRIEKAINLTVNGLLVVEKKFEVDSNNKTQKTINITVNYATGTPAGILAKEKIKFDNYVGASAITGVFYSPVEIILSNMANDQASFDIIGGMVGRKLTITSCWASVNITHNNDILLEVFPPTEFSPLILTEHWEEEY